MRVTIRAMNLVERCEQVLAQNTESSSVRGWRAAIAAAEVGDGAAAAAALEPLPEKARFAATVVLGLAFPSVLVETAETYDRMVPEGTVALDWQRCCEHLTVMRWAERARELDARVLARLLNRAYYGAAGLALLAAIRDRVHGADDLAGARKLYEAIPKFAKGERAAACALLGMVSRDATAVREAIAAATSAPIIQVGGEEAEALAAVLAEYAAAKLAADRAEVVATVRALESWGKNRVEKDVRSYGIAFAAQTCVRAGWMEHARALAEVLWDAANREPVEAAIASGVAAPARERTLDEPTLERVVAETSADYRLARATARALGRIDANDREAALAAMHAAFAASDASAGAADGEARVAWARALAAGGQRERAIAVLRAISPGGMPRTGCELAVELFGADAGPFVEAAIADGLAAVTYSWSRHEWPAAKYLAQLVARTNDAALETALIAATAVVRNLEDREHSQVGEQRRRRITETLRILADAYPELADATPTTERLDAWTAALGDHPASKGLIGGAAAALASLPLEDIVARCGGAVRSEHVRALAAEIAKRGRLADALTLIASHEPGVQHASLREIARIVTSAADRKKVIATYKKTKKSGRDKSAQGIWKFVLGSIQLACGDIDAAIATAADMDDVRVSESNAAYLARAIAKHLDTLPDGWTAARATALADVLGGTGVIPQDVRGGIFAVGPAAVAHGAQLATTRAKLTRAGDAALVDAVEGLGHVRANDRPRGIAQLERALELTLGGDWIYVDASDFVWCVGQLPRDIPERDALFAKAFQRLRRENPRDARSAITRIFEDLDPRDAPLAAATLAATELPQESAAHAHDQLGELVATTLDDAALLPLEATTDPVTATRRVQQAARHLARRGEHDAAMALAKRCGLAT